MPSKVAKIVVCALVALCWLSPITVGADSGPLDLDVNHYLTGNAGGAFDVYNVVAPSPTSAPVVTVQFSPASAAGNGYAGIEAYLNGTHVGSGQPDPITPGLVRYQMPHDPTGSAVIQVYSYNPTTPLGYTIQAQDVPSGAPNGPATGDNTTQERATPINGKLSGNLGVNTAGALAYFTFPSPGSNPPTTISMTYGPANATVNQAVGFTVFDQNQNSLATTSQPNGQNNTAGTIGVEIMTTPGQRLTIQVFNYAQGVRIVYRLSVSGIPPTSVTAASPFQPFWVENFITTELWSGPDSDAVSFGTQPQFSHFLVVRPQTSSRLFAYVSSTHNYAFVDAKAVGPSGPPME
jgi:hypothetical protein